MKKIVLFVLVLIGLSAPAFAATKSCYTMAQAEAEQGIRIHSELMVIGLNCQGMRFKDGTNLYLKYREFTNANVSLFSGYETQLMDYFKVRGDANPEASLNTLRTRFANEISNDAAKMNPDVFCNRYAHRIFKASAMDESKLRKWASTIYPSHPVSNPVCEQ
jgi:hypothetical protein